LWGNCEVYFKRNSKIVNRTRWFNLQNFIQGNGYKINFEHIRGKNNHLVDILSRKLLLVFDTNQLCLPKRNTMNTEANRIVKDEQSPINIASSSTTKKEELESPLNHHLWTI